MAKIGDIILVFTSTKYRNALNKLLQKQGGGDGGGSSGAGAGDAGDAAPKKKGKNKVADAQPAEWHGLWPRVENDQYRTPHPYWKGALKLVNFVHFTTVVDPFYNDGRSQNELLRLGPEFGFECKGPFQPTDFFQEVQHYPPGTVVVGNPPWTLTSEVMAALVKHNIPFVLICNWSFHLAFTKFDPVFEAAGVEKAKVLSLEEGQVTQVGFIDPKGNLTGKSFLKGAYYYWRTGMDFTPGTIKPSPDKAPVDPLQQAMTVPVEELTTVQEVEEMQARLDSAVDDERLDGGEAFVRNRVLAKRQKELQEEVLQEEKARAQEKERELQVRKQAHSSSASNQSGASNGNPVVKKRTKPSSN